LRIQSAAITAAGSTSSSQSPSSSSCNDIHTISYGSRIWKYIIICLFGVVYS
jgi:hypothetical protein